MSEFSLRKATKEDVTTIVSLCRDTIREVYGSFIPQEALRPWFEGDAVSALVSKQWPRMTVAVDETEAGGDEVVGVAAATEDAVDLLWVHPSSFGRGIGTALLGRLEEEMRAEGHRTGRLCCFSDNLRAMRFYQARGWTMAGDGINGETGAPETRMVKRLTDESGRSKTGRGSMER